MKDQGVLSRTARKADRYLPIGMVLLAVFVVYGNTLCNGFVMDDQFHILKNRWIRDLRYIPEIFSSNVWGSAGIRTGFYRPLISVILMLNYHIFGLAPWGYHLVNLLFHAGASGLVYLMALRLFTPSLSSPSVFRLTPPLAAALLFAVHPIHTEAVTWVSGIMDLSFTFFYLLSFYLYIRSTDMDPPQKSVYLLSVAAFFLSTLCKEPAVTLPIVLICYDVLFRKEGAHLVRFFKRYIPYFLAAGIYLAMRFYAIPGPVPLSASPGLTPYQNLINALVLFAGYLNKLVLPIGLNVWHVFHPMTSIASYRGIFSILTVLAFGGLALAALKKNRAAFLGCLLIVLPLMPALYLPALTQGIENAFTERYLYLPSLGLVLLLTEGLRWTELNKPGWVMALTVLFAAVIGLYSLETVRRNPVWKDSYSLWSDAVRKSRESATPHNALGEVFSEKGWIDRAMKEYETAVRIEPDRATFHVNLGVAYGKKGWADKALQEMQIALRLQPDFPEPHNNIGILYDNMGEHGKAIEQFQTAVKLDPFFEEAYRNLGIAYSNQNRMDDAIQSLKKALELNPQDADAHNNIGVAYAGKGNMEKAIEHFEAAVRLKPDEPDYQMNLSRAYKIKNSPAKVKENR